MYFHCMVSISLDLYLECLASVPGCKSGQVCIGKQTISPVTRNSLHLLYLHFWCYFLSFLHIWYQVFLSNTNNLQIVLWYQVFLSNTNNFHTVLWYQVFLSNTNNFHTVVGFQVFLSNTNNLQTVVWYQVFLSNTNNLQIELFDP